MEDKNSKIASNKEIIEELTKDLEEACLKDDSKDTGQIIDDQDDKFFDVKDNLSEWEKNDDENLEYFDSVDEHKSDVEVDVDEVALKDREINLSDEEKQVNLQKF